jgi:hypothetical protein
MLSWPQLFLPEEKFVVSRAYIFRCLRSAVGWALILLFGPAPLAPLFASSPDASQCQMACCKRGHCSCRMHHAAREAGPALDTGGACPGGCTHPSIAPSRVQGALLSPGNSLGLANVHRERVYFPEAPSISSARDPFLYQRPPPVLL